MNNLTYHIKSVIGLAFFILLAFGSSDEENTSRKSNYHKLLAYNIATEHVKANLKSPYSAKFPGANTKASHVTVLADGEFKISSWVDSQNSFGAMIRSQWACKAYVDLDDNVNITDLTIQ